MDYLKKLFIGGYDEIWKAIIRPPRDIYKDDELGPEKFTLLDKTYKRRDFYIYNLQNQKLYCSFWEPSDEERLEEKLPCVIYLHGNCSSRTEAFAEAQLLLPKGLTLFSFDFSGCGRSDGEYVSLGIKEKYDLEAIIAYLIKTNKVSNIALWGRSMGSVVAFKFCEIFNSTEIVKCIVADSPFSNLNILLRELATDKISLPKILIEKLLSLIKASVLKRGKFSIDDIDANRALKSIKCPIMFITGKNDDFIKNHHAHFLYENYKNTKSFIMFDGDHNTIRPRHIRQEVINFINNNLNETININKSKHKKSISSINIDNMNLENVTNLQNESNTLKLFIKQYNKKIRKKHIEDNFSSEDNSFTNESLDDCEVSNTSNETITYKDDGYIKTIENDSDDLLSIEKDFSENQENEIIEKLILMSKDIKNIG